MKKFFSVILAAILVICVLPAAAFAAGEAPEWFTLENVKTLISDDVLAAAVYDSVASDEEFWTNHSSLADTAAALAAYDGTITVTGTTSSSVNNLSGFNAMPAATFTLINNNNIFDLSTIDISYGVGVRTGGFYISGSPIHIWPAQVSEADGITYAIPTNFVLSGSATYVYGQGAATKVQKVIFDVSTKPGSGALSAATVLDPATDNSVSSSEAPKYVVSGGYQTTKTAPEASDTNATFNVTAKGTASTTVFYRALNYESSGATQHNNVSYIYKLSSNYLYLIDFEKEVKTEGGIYFAKYSDTDTEHTTPVAGAVYSLYKKGDVADEFIADYETKATEIAIEGLENGDYYLVEKTAPKGYALSDTKYEFTIDVDDEDAEIQFSSNLTSTKINKDDITFVPDWTSCKNGKVNAMKLVLTDTYYTSVAAGDYDSYAFLDNGNADSHITASYAVDNQNYEVEQTWTLGENEYTSGADLATAVNGMIDASTVTDNLNVALDVVVSLKEDSYQHVAAEDHLITIWVENTTGDADSAKASEGYELNVGGTVKVESYDDTKNAVSSDGADDNNTNRKPTNVVSGAANVQRGWRVDVDDIKVGLRGASESGAIILVNSGEAVEGGYKVQIGENIYTVLIDYDEANETVKVTIEDMDVDMDVAIPFYYEEEIIPELGDNSLLLSAVGMIVSVMGLAYIVISRKKKNC